MNISFLAILISISLEFKNIFSSLWGVLFVLFLVSIVVFFVIGMLEDKVDVIKIKWVTEAFDNINKHFPSVYLTIGIILFVLSLVGGITMLALEGYEFISSFANGSN